MNSQERREYNKQYYIAHREAIKKHSREYQIAHPERCREYKRKSAGSLPMVDNRSCPAFLGCYVAERMLSRLFKDVVRMPYHQHGYDFICANNYKIDVKSSCVHHDKQAKRADHWLFKIRENTVANFFLCMAFDNRESLNPLHLWLIPGKVLSHLSGAGISETTLDKWSEYEKPISEAINCCNIMKGV